MKTEINKERHCEGGTTEAIPLSGVAGEFGYSITGLLRAIANSIASARNDVSAFGLEYKSIIDN